MLTFGSLFAGIGGFDLGFERAGMTCKWQVEIDDYATRVLERHWPDVPRWRDVRTWPQPGTEPVDVICGGFPCQDISNAGKRAGLEGDRSGLFFEIIRIACELGPRFIVLENVAALLNRGLDRVLGELAEIGFDAEWHCIPASAVGAPHIRDRVWIVAYAKLHRMAIRRRDEDFGQGGQRLGRILSADSQGSTKQAANLVADSNGSRFKQGNKTMERQQTKQFDSSGFQSAANVSNTDNQGLEGRLQDRTAYPQGWQKSGDGRDSQRGPEWSGSRNSQWSTEPNVGRVAHGIPHRVDRLRCLGNAIVPQVAELVGRRVLAINEMIESGEL